MVSLKKEIPVMEMTKEGELVGGFVSLDSALGDRGLNTNCPSGPEASCGGNSSSTSGNVNCPTGGGGCKGNFDGSPGSNVNINCPSSGSCSGNDLSTTKSPKAGGTILGDSLLI